MEEAEKKCNPRNVQQEDKEMSLKENLSSANNSNNFKTHTIDNYESLADDANIKASSSNSIVSAKSQLDKKQN